MTTENTSPKPSFNINDWTQYKVSNQQDWEAAINWCRSTFGQRGSENGWYWKPVSRSNYRSGIMLYFRDGSDATALALSGICETEIR